MQGTLCVISFFDSLVVALLLMKILNCSFVVLHAIEGKKRQEEEVMGKRVRCAYTAKGRWMGTRESKGTTLGGSLHPFSILTPSDSISLFDPLSAALFSLPPTVLSNHHHHHSSPSFSQFIALQ
ncbi:hypothetical protein BKA57DRAFT_167623 [Linnemannia elongata]|nr:hypothetical protein BKA57DRAFT_167623 [Linnemannia elongata]